MRDDSCSDVHSKGAHGRDIPLPGTVGNRSTEVRELNIAYDFGTDPHALAWTIWEWGPDYYHYWVYDDFHEATRWLLWTVEYYHEPVIVAVNGGSHWVLVIGYEAERSATHPDGPGTIQKIGYADPLINGPVCDDYTWVPYDTGYNNWAETFTPYTHPNDPDPETGWYGYFPRNHGQHWYGHYVTIERDWGGLSPDWGRSLSGAIPPYPWRAEYLSHATPTSMEKDNTYIVRITFRDTGSQDWPLGDPNTSGVVSLSYHWVQRGSATNPIYPGSAGMVTWEGLRTGLPYGVPDATGVTLYAQVQAPGTAGSYTLMWDVVREGYTWFNWQGSRTLNVDVEVEEPPPDTTPPTNPTSVSSSSHAVSTWSNDQTVSVSWSGADDDQSGVWGYSIEWNESPSAVPDAVVDTTGSSDTSSSLPDGDDWHFHVRTVDNAGNWNSGAAQLGPFYIETMPPSSNIVTLPITQTKTWFLVEWTGSDAASGLGSGEIQYRRGMTGTWTTYTTVSAETTEVLFIAALNDPNQLYCFRSRATDVAGNVEDYPVEPDYDTCTTTGTDSSGLSRVYIPLILKDHQ